MKCLLLLCIFGWAAAKNLNDERHSRLIGTESSASSLYEVAILSKDRNGVIKVCTGAMIHPLWIITSATCASRSKNLRIQFANKVQITWTGALVDMRIIHYSYVPETMVNDIALLKLFTPSIDSVDILEIAESNDKFIGKVGMVSGFGVEKVGGTAGTLREAFAGIQSSTFCKKEGDIMSANQFCTYPTLTCEGDQGSPFVIDSKLVGLLTMSDSFAMLCGSQFVSKYNYVAFYRPWIRISTSINWL